MRLGAWPATKQNLHKLSPAIPTRRLQALPESCSQARDTHILLSDGSTIWQRRCWTETRKPMRAEAVPSHSAARFGWRMASGSLTAEVTMIFCVHPDRRFAAAARSTPAPPADFLLKARVVLADQHGRRTKGDPDMVIAPLL